MSSARDTDYALGGTTAEYSRLIEQAELLRPLTERMLRAADPAAAVRRIAGKVRPGGIVAFTDGWRESRRRPQRINRFSRLCSGLSARHAV